MSALADVIRAGWVEWRGEPVVERLVYGTDDADEIAARIDRLCVDHLGAPVVAGRFHKTSVTIVTGVDLADGRSVVVRAHQPDRTSEFLDAVQTAQRRLVGCGLPVAAPLLGPTPLITGLATAETVIDDPGYADGRAPGATEAAAATLATVAATLAHLQDGWPAHPQDRTAGALYPPPHSPIFDFEATAEGAEWIDELAREAVAARDAVVQPLVLTHFDWTARNVRVVDGSVVAAFDWESLSVGGEPSAVGQQAVVWPCTSEPDSPPMASPDEVAAFVAAYEAARGSAFGAERAAVGPAALFILCYVARCEHAIERAGVALAALRTHGRAYLDI